MNSFFGVIEIRRMFSEVNLSKPLQKNNIAKLTTHYMNILYIATLNLSTYMYIVVHLDFGTPLVQNSFVGKLLYCCYGPGLK